MKPDAASNAHFSGWTTLLGAMLAYGCICGDVTYAFGVFLPAMSETMGWSRSALSGPYSLFLIIGGMLGPLAGAAISRFGARKNIMAGNLTAALGLAGMSQVQELWHAYFFFGVMGGLGLAFAEFLAMTTVVNSWFIRKRSLALGLLLAAGGIGGFILPPLVGYLMSGYGWRWTWICLGVLHLLLGVVLAGLLIRNTPEELGQAPDGRPWAPQGETAASRRVVYSTGVDFTVRDAFKTPALWMILALFSSVLFVHNIMTTHQVAYLRDLNYSSVTSAAALGLMLGMSILGRLLSGLLGLRFEGRHLAVFFSACMGLGVVSLINAQGGIFVYLYAVLTGIGFGGMIVLLPNLTGAYYGRSHFSRIVGWTTPVVTLASAASPLLAGWLFDQTGRYLAPLSLAAALLFVCCLLAVFARPPHPPASAQISRVFDPIKSD